MSAAAPILAFGAAALATAGAALLWPARLPRGGAWRRFPSRGSAGDGSRLIAALVRLGVRLRPARPPLDLEARIAAAGRPGGLGARELMAAKLAAAAGAACVALLAAQLAPGRLGLALMAAGPVAGFLAPDIWLRRRAAERARLARRELPGLLDLLRVTVEAGTSLPASLAAVGRRASGPLAAEWRAVGSEVALGVPLAGALEAMAQRLPLPEVRALVAALERSRRHGAPLAETLAAQARDARFALRRHIQEEGARAGPKIQLVVALLLVPSVLLLVAAALAAALLDSGAGLLGG